jgi:hypothetical protein
VEEKNPQDILNRTWDNFYLLYASSEKGVKNNPLFITERKLLFNLGQRLSCT